MSKSSRGWVLRGNDDKMSGSGCQMANTAVSKSKRLTESEQWLQTRRNV